MKNHQLFFLSGPSFVGKTTVLSQLSCSATIKKNLLAIDLDGFIEGLFQKTINNIFKNETEEKFREMETQALGLLLENIKKILMTPNLKDPLFIVIALGGGALLKDVNQKMIEDIAAVISSSCWFITTKTFEHYEKIIISSSKQEQINRPLMTMFQKKQDFLKEYYEKRMAPPPSMSLLNMITFFKEDIPLEQITCLLIDSFKKEKALL